MNVIKLPTGLVLSLGLCLALAGESVAQRFPPDPVKDLSKSLENFNHTPPTVSAEELSRVVDKVEGPSDLARALLLTDWGLDAVQVREWKKLNERFKTAAPKALDKRDSNLALGMANKIIGLADSVPFSLIAPRTPLERQTLLEASLADLFPALAELAQSPDSAVRAAAVRAVARLRANPDKVLAWMKELLNHPDARTRQAVAESLGTMIEIIAGQENTIPYTDETLRDNLPLLEASLALVPPTRAYSKIVALAGQALGDSDPEVRRLALVALEKSTIPLTEVPRPLIFFLSEDVKMKANADVRAKLEEYDRKYEEAVRGADEERSRGLPQVIGEQGGAIGAALVNPNDKVKVAARHVGEIPARTRQKLQRFGAPAPKMNDGRPKTEKPVDAGKIVPIAFQAQPQDPLPEGIRKLLPGLAAGLGDPSPELRIRAAESVVALGKDALAPDVVRALNKALTDPNLFVQWVAARALGRMMEEVEAADEADKPRQLALLQTAVPALVQLLSTRDLDVRMAVEETIEKYGPAAQEAVPLLTKYINNGDAESREKAILALQGVGLASRPAIPELIEALGRKTYAQVSGSRGSGAKVRRAAAELLGKFGKEASAAIPALRKALADEDEDVRRAATDALLQITGGP